ncbi:HalOD1 output domain-containing protein [Natrinema sp. SYSU A 869]|uniref:HalOD1 output domain-containing protein n=1 Tax=Natrinema sp. SYSU A 869 TaxID=2871694 RepID=UPI001CA38A9F|nr:HalOD1 output domain-containing protein [Natrinema sp. SYSU A 869]
MPGSDRDPPGERPLLAERTYDDTTPASIAVVYAISAALDTDPIDCSTEHGFTLYDHLDPEALNALVTDDRRNGSVTVELSLNDHLLRVTDSGRVRVLGPSGSDS